VGVVHVRGEGEGRRYPGAGYCWIRIVVFARSSAEIPIVELQAQSRRYCLVVVVLSKAWSVAYPIVAIVAIVLLIPRRWSH
jgi:hypothetical protein